jgi:tight adherence protein C
MRKALFEMARQYQREKKKKRKEIFEELLITCREIERGVTEESAYENLADRCELADYRTLSVLFVQNQKRGGAGIMKNLEDEVLMAFGERKRQARIAADAASLKLLIPLGLMLMIAFALMMIPAFLSI